MKRRRLLLGAGVTVVLVAVVVAISAGKQRADSAAPSARVASTGTGEVGSAVGNLEATDISGREVRAPVAGKPGAIWFFASWCGECVPEGKALGRLERELGSEVSITAISSDPSDSQAALRGFRRTVGDPRFPFVWDSRGTVAKPFEVSALDTTLIFDGRGKVVYRDAGPTDLPALRAAFRKAGAS